MLSIAATCTSNPGAVAASGVGFRSRSPGAVEPTITYAPRKTSAGTAGVLPSAAATAEVMTSAAE